ncbi:MAG: hypothetical protein CMJ19_24925 [Phycisphaeraceae bacterium]|nr:hypothetical protein [Phycisphaeraceae bacterium]
MVVFRTGGVIELVSKIQIINPYLTIAGQTAPGDGICLKGSPIYINTHDVIVRGLRIRPGDGQVGTSPGTRDCLAIGDGSYNVIIDHCSFSWSQDENVNIWAMTSANAPHDCTVQWCIIAEGLYDSNHPDGPHSMGCLIGGGQGGRDVLDISMHHNLLAHNNARNPQISRGVHSEWINNIIYNWGTQTAIIIPYGNETPANDAMTNWVRNYWIAGPDSVAIKEIRYNKLTAGTMSYLKGNYGPNRAEGTTDGVMETAIIDKAAYATITNYAFTPWGVIDQDGEVALLNVLTSAGALAPARDTTDNRIVDEVIYGTGSIIDSPSDVGGYPTYALGTAPTDTDNDGMADDWEANRGLNVGTNDSAGYDLDNNYTNIEVYINGLIDQLILPENLLGYWHFNDANLTADLGSGYLTMSLNTGSPLYFGGTLQNALPGYDAGDGLVIGNGTSNHGATLVFQVDTTNRQNLSMSFSCERKNQGFTSNQVSYATSSNGPWTNFGSPFVPVKNVPNSFTFDFSSVTALDNNAAVYIRVTLDGAGSDAANARNIFDNVLIYATPMP